MLWLAIGLNAIRGDNPRGNRRECRLIPQDEATLADAVTRSGTLVGRLGVLLLVTVAAAVGVEVFAIKKDAP